MHCHPVCDPVFALQAGRNSLDFASRVMFLGAAIPFGPSLAFATSGRDPRRSHSDDCENPGDGRLVFVLSGTGYGDDDDNDDWYCEVVQ